MLTPLLLILAAAPASPFTWSGQTSVTPEVSISLVKGSVQVEGVDGNTVSVEARGADGTDLQRLIQVEQDGDEVEIEVCCGPCTASKKKSCAQATEVALVVKVPRGASLDASVVSAPLTVKGVTGKQELTGVESSITVHGSREALEVVTVQGKVELVPEVLGKTEVSTVSGDVTLKLPRGAGAEVEYASVGGRFDGKSVTLGSASKRYGDGKGRVEVSTVSGALDIQSEDSTK
ncbi:hypothetical protein [Melittangium boletus]|uniref:hypothetical protein n=1 Tax=Melittangium boletus TaxID=83453 RepID=UPI003DA29FC3